MPEGSTILADKGYTDNDYEDLLKEIGVHLKAQRKKNSKRPMPAWEEFLGKPIRQHIDTVFSRLTTLFARKIHVVTPRGFELKIVCFLLAFSIQCPQGATRIIVDTVMSGGGVGCSSRRGFSRLGDLQDLQAPDLSSGGEHRQRDGNAAAPHDHAGPQGACPFGDGADQDRSQRH